MLGILANRLNMSLIAYNWNAPVHYFPSWQELIVAAAVGSAQIWVFRWVVRRVPIFSDPPAWARAHGQSPSVARDLAFSGRA